MARPLLAVSHLLSDSEGQPYGEFRQMACKWCRNYCSIIRGRRVSDSLSSRMEELQCYDFIEIVRFNLTVRVTLRTVTSAEKKLDFKITTDTQ